MDLKNQIIQEYLTLRCCYRILQRKYGISRTTICKWVQIYQGIKVIPRSKKQQSHYIRVMKDPGKKRVPKKIITSEDLLKRISTLEKQLEWEKLRSDSLHIMINVA